MLGPVLKHRNPPNFFNSTLLSMVGEWSISRVHSWQLKT
ncbi:MAG: hypothetical protein ACI9MJ_002509 [Alphaproteobacteria bacterium]